MKNLLAYMVLFTLVMSPIAAAEDQLPGPGILPDSPFYGLKRALEAVGTAFTFGDEAKIKRGMKLAEMRLAEMQAMAEKGKPEFVDALSDEYEAKVDEALERARNAKQTANREQLLVRVSEATMRHIGVLEGVLAEVPEQFRASIMTARETSMTGNLEALESLGGDNPERARELIEEASQSLGEDPAQERYEELERRVDEISTQSGTETEAETGEESGNNFRILVSDAPADIGDFEYLIVHFSSTRIFSNGGFEERDLNASADLTQLVGGNSTEVLATELEPGTYNKIELYVGSVDAKASNNSADVTVPSGKLQIVSGFEIVEGEVTTFVFDINVVRKGHTNEYNLLPVISKSGVVGKDLDEDDIEEVEPDECNDEVPCSEGFECIDGKCEEADEPECSGENPCEEGYECISGECEAVGEPEEEPETPENTTALNETA